MIIATTIPEEPQHSCMCPDCPVDIPLSDEMCAACAYYECNQRRSKCL